MRLGIFGGTFNPIHFGHLRAAEEVRYIADLEKIIFVPSGIPPLKVSGLIDASHRYVMTERAIRSNKGFIVSDVEVSQREKSYTVRTLDELAGRHPRDELFFILGIDAFLDIPNWWRSERLVEMTDFIVVTRPGHHLSDLADSPYIDDLSLRRRGANGSQWKMDKGKGSGSLCGQVVLKSGRSAFLVPLTPLDISSTMIRNLLKAGMSIKYLLPEDVEHYIYSQNLYRA